MQPAFAAPGGGRRGAAPRPGKPSRRRHPPHRSKPSATADVSHNVQLLPASRTRHPTPVSRQAATATVAWLLAQAVVSL
jgi:hypothetical protein